MFGSRSNGFVVLILSILLALTACGGTVGDENAVETAAPPAESRVSTADQTASTMAGPVSESATEEGGSFWLGEPRDDVGRFFGLYGDADHPEPGRGQFFVTEAKRPEYA